MKKIVAYFLCLTTLLGVVLFPAYAEDIDDGSADEQDVVTVFYDIDGRISSEQFCAGEEITLIPDFAMRQFEDRMIVGWETEDGEKYYYNNTEFEHPYGNTDLVLQSGETCTFYPIWCPIALRKEEVFSFKNNYSVFGPEETGTFLTSRDNWRMFFNWAATFTFSPFVLPAALLYLYFKTTWMKTWNGACCGFASTTLLQHYGKIDLLSDQGVSSVCELVPDDTVKSALNYYNIQAASVGLLTDHVAIQPETEEYSKQLHALYDTLEGGTPVYFELYVDYPHQFYRLLDFPLQIIQILTQKSFDKYEGNGGNHGVVLTGAYTDGDGNHILIMYDNNSLNYSDGTCDIIYINSDFTQIHSSYAQDGVLKGFSWNDEFSQFDSFKLDGISNPFAWHVQFLKRLPSLMRQIVTFYATR